MLSRRQFLERGGLFVGAAAIGTWPPAPAEAALAPAAELSASRAATYSALVEALALAPHETKVFSKEEQEDTMSHWYRASGRADRSYVDAVLDGIEDATAPRSFDQSHPRERLAMLRSWVRHAAPTNSGRLEPMPAKMEKRALASAALVLATIRRVTPDYPVPSMAMLSGGET